MEIMLAETTNQMHDVAATMLELRDAYTKEALIAQMKRQQEHGYTIAYGKVQGKTVCVAGFVVTEKLAWGKHLYVDDLVTAFEHRSMHYGRILIEWLEAYASAQGCREMHLDSGVQRFAAHRFYAKTGFAISSHHFSKKIR